MRVNEKITELMYRYQAFCRAIAFSLVHDYDAAEDVVQNAFVKAYLALLRYDPQRTEELRVQPWLYKIVVNEARNYLARKHDLIRLGTEEGKWVDELEGSEQEHPEIVAMYEEQKGWLDELLNLLPSTSQETIEFWLRFGGSYQDIAQAFDVDVRTVRTRFHRATERLKNLMSKKQIRESDLRQGLQANRLALEEEWEGWRRNFSLHDYIHGEAYANVFGGHPYRGQFLPEDDYAPEAFLPPSYWN